MATRWINKGPTAEGTGNAHGFSANDDGVIIHHNGEMFGTINSDKIWPLTQTGGARAIPPYASGANFIVKNAGAIAFTLPPTKLGYKFTIYMAVASSGAHTITPVSVDKFLQAGKTDGQALTYGGTQAIGDSITLIGDGADGWLVSAKTGTGTWT